MPCNDRRFWPALLPGRILPLKRTILCGALLLPAALCAQNEDAVEVAKPAPALSDERILGIIPNFQTVTDPTRPVAPLTVKQKWQLFAKETLDPYAFFGIALGAGMSQATRGFPNYGEGARSFRQRFGAAFADATSQNFFADAVLAPLFHEDPRYFRKGPQSRFLTRVGYALSRVAITRTDAGSQRVNFSGLLGTGMGIALSNAYYPAPNINGSVVASRFGTSLSAGALGNLLPEFWPDIKQKFARQKRP
jgi:hypothetical protein